MSYTYARAIVPVPLSKLTAVYGITREAAAAAGATFDARHAVFHGPGPGFDLIYAALKRPRPVYVPRPKLTPEQAAAAREQHAERIAAAGRVLWADLHRWALTVPLGGENASRAVLDAALVKFSQRVPCGECRQHWVADVAANPPDYSDNLALFNWTVDRHNGVNARTGKPVLMYGEARNIWGPAGTRPAPRPNT